MHLARPVLLTALTLAAAGSLPLEHARAQSGYILVDLGTFGGNASAATAINDAGIVVGIAELPGGDDRGFVWSGGAKARLEPPGGTASQAYGINRDGDVVGAASIVPGGPPQPVLWRGGLPVQLGSLGGALGIAYSINDAGDIVGYAAVDSGAPHAFLHRDGGMLDLGTFDGAASGALAINNAGWIVGSFQLAPGGSVRRAFLRLPDGSWQTLASFGGTIHHAYDINDAGVIVGASRTVGGLQRAYLIDAAAGGAILDLGSVSGTQGAALGIDESGRIVGSFAGAAPPPRGFVRTQGMATDLNDGLLGAKNWVVTEARAINRRGWIAGSATNPAGQPRAVLLLPRGPAASALSNLSVRAGLRVDRPLIAGVVVSGAGGRELLARGIGPGLRPLLPAGSATAGDPALTVFDDGGKSLATNDNWGGLPAVREATERVGAFPIDDAGLDAALLGDFSGPRTVHLGTTTAGVGLVELYDADTPEAGPRLANLSARYVIGAGVDVLVAGFAIEGGGAKALLIRGIGPGLAGHGVSGFLIDPRLSVHDAAGTRIAENDDWAANLDSVFAEAGAFPLIPGSADAALVLSLEPGAYTVHLSGGDGAPSEGLIEIYDLDL